MEVRMRAMGLGLLWAGMGVVPILGVASGALGAPETVREIQDCVERNLPENGSTQAVLLRAVDRTGEELDSRAEVVWKRDDEQNSRVLMRIEAPAERRGSILLGLQRDDEHADMWLYLPELRKVKRIGERTVSGSMFGTDYTYEDFQRVYHLAKEAKTQRGPDEEVKGRATFVLEHRPDEGTSEYDLIKSYIDREMCVLLRSEHYGSGDRLTKLLTVPLDKIEKEPSGWVPKLSRMEDLLDKTHTDLIVESIDVEKPVPDRLFSVNQLEREGR
jgi:hypothetical protein